MNTPLRILTDLLADVGHCANLGPAKPELTDLLKSHQPLMTGTITRTADLIHALEIFLGTLHHNDRVAPSERQNVTHMVQSSVDLLRADLQRHEAQNRVAWGSY